MHETRLGESSPWSTYLRLFARNVGDDLPMFWSPPPPSPQQKANADDAKSDVEIDREMSEQLATCCSHNQATFVLRNVAVDAVKMSDEYERVIAPFVRRSEFLQLHANNTCQESYTDFEAYRRLVAFVMAYSFREPPPSADES